MAPAAAASHGFDPGRAARSARISADRSRAVKRNSEKSRTLQMTTIQAVITRPQRIARSTGPKPVSRKKNQDAATKQRNMAQAKPVASARCAGRSGWSLQRKESAHG